MGRQFQASPTRGLGTVTYVAGGAAMIAPCANGMHLQATAGADQLARISELEERLEEQQSLAQKVQAELNQTCEERDAARRELAEVVAQLARQGRAPTSVAASAAQQSPPAVFAPAAAALSVPHSWQPGLQQSPALEAGRSRERPTSPDGEGPDEGADTFPGPSHEAGLMQRQPVATAPGRSVPRDRRMSDKSVEIVVSVPRAMTHEELLAEQEESRGVASRSVRSLAQAGGARPHQVQRLPSAPVSALSQHVSLAAALQGPCQSFHQASPSVAMHGGMRVVGNSPVMSVAPSAPASFAAPPGGAHMARFMPHRSVAPMAQAFVGGYQVMR